MSHKDTHTIYTTYTHTRAHMHAHRFISIHKTSYIFLITCACRGIHMHIHTCAQVCVPHMYLHMQTHTCWCLGSAPCHRMLPLTKLLSVIDQPPSVIIVFYLWSSLDQKYRTLKNTAQEQALQPRVSGAKHDAKLISCVYVWSVFPHSLHIHVRI